jgi:hypothetical protein
MRQSPDDPATSQRLVDLSIILMIGLLLAALRLLTFWTTLRGNRALMPLLPLLCPEIVWFPHAAPWTSAQSAFFSALLVVGTLLWTTIVYVTLTAGLALLKRTFGSSEK